MTYADSNPERRNLIALSLSIIIFYLGEGYLLKPEISFTLVNIGFHNQGILIKFIWVMLFWFLFRYVVTNRHSYADELDKTGVLVNLNYAPVRKYLINNGHQKNIRALNKVKVFRRYYTRWCLVSPEENVTVNLKGLDGYLIIKLYLLKTIFKHRATSDYYSPYLLFLFAVSLGAHNYLFDISTVIPALIAIFSLATINVMYYIRN